MIIIQTPFISVTSPFQKSDSDCCDIRLPIRMALDRPRGLGIIHVLHSIVCGHARIAETVSANSYSDSMSLVPRYLVPVSRSIAIFQLLTSMIVVLNPPCLSSCFDRRAVRIPHIGRAAALTLRYSGVQTDVGRHCASGSRHNGSEPRRHQAGE